jgi:hypothetical protein
MDAGFDPILSAQEFVATTPGRFRVADAIVPS